MWCVFVKLTLLFIPKEFFLTQSVYEYYALPVLLSSYFHVTYLRSYLLRKHFSTFGVHRSREAKLTTVFVEFFPIEIIVYVYSFALNLILTFFKYRSRIELHITSQILERLKIKDTLSDLRHAILQK